MSAPEPSENTASPEEIEAREEELTHYGTAVMNVTEPSDDEPEDLPEEGETTQAELPYEEIAAELTPDQRRRVAALNEARDVLVGDLASQSSMFGGSQGGDRPYTTAKGYATDLLTVAEYIIEGLLSAEVQSFEASVSNGVLVLPDAIDLVEVDLGHDGIPTIIRAKVAEA